MGSKFIKEKKTSEPYYTIPAPLAANIGIFNISESGICCYGNNIYSKAFSVREASSSKATSTERIKGSMMVLRGYDVPFKYIEYMDGQIILDINVTAKDFEEAKNILSHLEEEMISSLFTFGMLIDAMKLQDRLRFLHQKYMRERENARIDVNDYLKNTSWPADLDVKKFKESKRFLKTETDVKSYYYIRKMPSENVGTLYEAIRNQPGVTDVMIDYEPVSDMDVYLKVRELYDDVPEEEPPKEDSRRNIMAGICFAISGTEETIERRFESLKEVVYPFGCAIVPYYNKQFQAFKAFATFKTDNIKQLRIIQVANAVTVNPFNKEVVKKDQEKKQLLEEFDLLMNSRIS